MVIHKSAPIVPPLITCQVVIFLFVCLRNKSSISSHILIIVIIVKGHIAATLMASLLALLGKLSAIDPAARATLV